MKQELSHYNWSINPKWVKGFQEQAQEQRQACLINRSPTKTQSWKSSNICSGPGTNFFRLSNCCFSVFELILISTFIILVSGPCLLVPSIHSGSCNSPASFAGFPELWGKRFNGDPSFRLFLCISSGYWSLQVFLQPSEKPFLVLTGLSTDLWYHNIIRNHCTDYF